MANYRTLGADFSAGLRAPHYVNGRLLTAEDLQQEQQTQLERLAHTGRAAGYGIVEGFVVAAAANKTALQITAGIGLNRQGYVVHLAAEQVTLPVQPAAPDGTPVRRSSRFAACVDDGGEQPASTADGAYLLTAAPLAQLQGFAPRQACDGTATSTCANQWEIEGVEFKIIRLTAYSPPTGNRAGRNRNLLAHWFYGSDALLTLMRDPFQFDAAYSGFDELAAADFTLCDLPLAVFYWADGQIAFVDQWAVRRCVVRAYPAAAWAANLSDQRRAEGEARFLQFQEQIADVQAAAGAATDAIRAVDRFAYLPPVGMLPVNPFALIVADVFEAALSERQQGQIRELGLTVAQVLARVRAGVLDTLGSRAVFNLEQFFGEFLPPAYSIVHEDLVHDRLHQSWVQPPIALPPPSTQGGLFDLTLADGTLVAVNDNNFGGILDNLSRRFSGTVFSHVAATPAAPPGRAAPASAIALNRDALIRATLNRAFQPPLEIFNPPRGKDNEVESLVDILVVDELLDPYRDQLARDMSGRIDAAITALSGAGGVFTGVNRFTAVNASIANAFTLHSFLSKGSLAGRVDFGKLIQLINQGKQPIFYVVFARRRPPVINRPLRL